MNKPIKEIGRIYFSVFSADGGRAYGALTPEAALMFAKEHGMEGDSKQDFFDGQFLTIEERRELVRRVWDAALDHCEFDSFSGPRVTKSSDDWLKEQGL